MGEGKLVKKKRGRKKTAPYALDKTQVGHELLETKI